MGWAKLSRIPPNEVFHGKTFTVPYIYSTQTTPLWQSLYIYLRKNFHGTLENCKKHKSLAQRIFPTYGN